MSMMSFILLKSFIFVVNVFFEPELALLVGLQVVSSKRKEEEGALSDKFFDSLRQKIK